MAAAKVVDGNDAEHRHQRGADQGDQVAEGHVGPPAVIMAQEKEDGKFDRHDPGQPGPELRRLVAGQGQHEVGSQQHRQPEHQGENRQVPRRHRPEAQRRQPMGLLLQQPTQPRRHGGGCAGSLDRRIGRAPAAPLPLTVLASSRLHRCHAQWPEKITCPRRGACPRHWTG